MILDIPTSVSPREQLALRRYADDRWVLEFGSLLGASTITMAQVARSVTSVDKYTQYSVRGSSKRALFRNLARYQHTFNHVATFNECVLNPKQLWSGITSFQQFAFIDLTGQYRISKRALEIVSRVPVVAIHDCTRAFCRGVVQAVEESGRPTLEHVDTLVVLGARR